LNPSLPSEVLWNPFESIGVKYSVDANVIYSPAKLGSYYESLCFVAPPVTAHFMDAWTDESRFSFANVNAMEVHRAIFCNKSNAVGLGGISVKLIFPIILPCVLHTSILYWLVLVFLLNGKYLNLSQFKKKKINHTELGDYRIIRILPTKTKAMEIVMRDQIFVFVDIFSLLDCLQSGFQSKHGIQLPCLRWRVAFNLVVIVN
jgi:hypothetical protein